MYSLHLIIVERLQFLFNLSLLLQTLAMSFTKPLWTMNPPFENRICINRVCVEFFYRIFLCCLFEAPTMFGYWMSFRSGSGWLTVQQFSIGRMIRSITIWPTYLLTTVNSC